MTERDRLNAEYRAWIKQRVDTSGTTQQVIAALTGHIHFPDNKGRVESPTINKMINKGIRPARREGFQNLYKVLGTLYWLGAIDKQEVEEFLERFRLTQLPDGRQWDELWQYVEQAIQDNGDAAQHIPQFVAKKTPERRQFVAGLIIIVVLILTVFLVVTSIDNETLVEVSALERWQSTGLQISTGDSIHLRVVEGRWTYWRGGATPPYDTGAGSDYICTDYEPKEDCDELIPDAPAGALIGRIGIDGEPFLVGHDMTLHAQSSGVLYLRINDDDAGLDDNDGTLVVSITRQAPSMSGGE